MNERVRPIQPSTLYKRMKQELSQFPDNRIPFSHYMSRCLYDAEDGYYMKKQPKVGREGDFYTSVFVGDAMARMISRFFLRCCKERGWKNEEVRIVEWGSGTGRLACQCIRALHKAGRLPKEYVLIEQSSYHREESRRVLSSLQGEEISITMQWWDQEELAQKAQDAPIFLIANELLDAFPVERVRRHGEQIEQAYVKMNAATNELEWFWMEPTNGVKRWICEHQINLHEGQIYEAGIYAARWLQQVLDQLHAAELLFLDYGDGTAELTAEHRMEGTLLCYHRHQVNDNPLMLPGEQDITAHVDFDVMARAAKGRGAIVHPLRTQQQFLLDEGILDELCSHQSLDPFSQEARQNRVIRQLLLSDGMSERFHVLHLSKEDEAM